MTAQYNEVCPLNPALSTPFSLVQMINIDKLMTPPNQWSSAINRFTEHEGQKSLMLAKI